MIIDKLKQNKIVKKQRRIKLEEIMSSFNQIRYESLNKGTFEEKQNEF